LPKLQCKCGYVHNLSPIPDEGWRTVLDKEYENLLEAEKIRDKLSGAKENTATFNDLLKADNIVSSAIGLMYECPDCKSLMWEKQGEDKFTTYEVCEG